jgi:hypothetical protein
MDQAMNKEPKHADQRAIRDQMKQSKRRRCGLWWWWWLWVREVVTEEDVR